jgi:hypothetical protein
MSLEKKSAGAPDLELKKAFGELQGKMVETQQKMKLSDLQIENLKRTITHSQLTQQVSKLMNALFNWCLCFLCVALPISHLSNHFISSLN